jgi:TetR/AcrR family transcriptional regulator
MAKKARLSMRDLEDETEKFLAPTTDKERAILHAAMELIGERGIDGATTAEIARRADVTEKTLFRYFPSKQDLVRRVLYPVLLRGGLTRGWEGFETLLRTQGSSLKSWYTSFTKNRIAATAQNPALARTLLTELAHNEELRKAIGALWREKIWGPMLETLDSLQASGAIRKEVDVQVLARAIHCLNVGYFLSRHVLAADLKWDDAAEIEKMAEILTNGAASDADAPIAEKAPDKREPSRADV